MNELTQINVILRSIISQTVPNAVQQHPISQPAAVQTLPIGTMLSGNLVGRDPRGGFILKTPKGDVLIKTDQHLSIGSKVELIIESNGDNVRARIFSVDGRLLETPVEGAEQQPSIVTTSTDANEPALETYGKNFRNLALAQQAKTDMEMFSLAEETPKIEVKIQELFKPQISLLKQQTPLQLANILDNITNGNSFQVKISPAILPQVANSIGLGVEMIDIPEVITQQFISPNNTSSPQKPQIVQPGIQQSLPMQTLKEQKVVDALFPEFSGEEKITPHAGSVQNTLSQKILQQMVTQTEEFPNTATQRNMAVTAEAQQKSPAATTQKIMIVGNSLLIPAETLADPVTNEVLIKTPVGVLKPTVTQQLTPGQSFTIVISEPAVASALQGEAATSSKSSRFENLDALIRAAQMVDQSNVLMNTINQVVPQPNRKMAASMMFLLSALSGGNVRKLLGDAFQYSTDSMQKAETIKKAIAEISGATQYVTDKSEQQWQAFYIPVYDGEKLNQLSLYVKRDPEKQRDNMAGDEDSRFVFDVNFSHLGRMQFDGFLKGQKNIELVVRSQQQLADNIKSNIYSLFSDALELTGYKGSLIFTVTREFAVELKEAEAQDTNGGMMV